MQPADTGLPAAERFLSFEFLYDGCQLRELARHRLLEFMCLEVDTDAHGAGGDARHACDAGDDDDLRAAKFEDACQPFAATGGEERAVWRAQESAAREAEVL